MNAFSRAIFQIAKGAAKAFRSFPAAVAGALAFTVVTLIRIQLDWPAQEPYNFLLNCLHLSFALSAVFSLAAITLAYSRVNRPGALLCANLLGAAAAAAAFLLLFFFGGAEPASDSTRFTAISGIAAARVGAAMAVSLLAFVVLAAYPKERSDFARSFFMTHKAFFIALIYGLVILGGLSGVAGAIQTLLYQDMSEKVYLYIGTLTGFAAFTIFIGYFPDFRQNQTDERREITQKQPRFIEVLFTFILIPMMLALTAVLLLWACKTVITGTWPPFSQLFGIAAAYAGGGVWLHWMVTHYDTKLAVFYRMVFPVATLVILSFEAWALLIRLGQSGLKTTEYFFILIWLAAAAAAVLLLLRKARSHTAIVAVICILTVFAVLPGAGYHALPVTAQLNRLESLLTSAGMLKDNELVPAQTPPAEETRESITDAVIFLAYSKGAGLPAWFDSDLGDGSVFKEKLGFGQTWPDFGENDEGRYLGTYLTLSDGVLDIGGYRWSVALPEDAGKEPDFGVTLEGDKGSYRITWTTNAPEGVPSLKIELDGRVILEEGLGPFVDRVASAHPPGQGDMLEADIQDMSCKLETPEADVLLVFSNISINVDTVRDTVRYWVAPDTLYLSENT